MFKIVTILGARPQFVKAAVVSRELNRFPNKFREIIVHTGQHFDKNMSEVFFQQMDIPKPNYYLGINSLSHGAMTGQMLEKIEEVLQKERPDLVLIYGDTNSTLAGALAAVKLHIPVAHVEAGLRSFNMNMPEEVNRILADRVSSYLFCPTQQAVENLKKEGFANIPAEIILSGDVMQDAAIYYAAKDSVLPEKLQQLTKGDFVLCTLHRQENTDDPVRLENLVNALNEIHREMPVLLPLHPRTRKILNNSNLKLQVNVTEPLGYLEMVQLLQKCRMVMTDSGGLQKEAFFFKKHCITLRDETEWVELVEGGYNMLAGADRQKIIAAFKEMRQKTSDFEVDLYGGGKAGQRIVARLLKLAD
ncbi:MAG: UDP-N-acetylglucosamine 2-epimerase (non-hydrolyzing) [Calditrichia bacterium]